MSSFECCLGAKMEIFSESGCFMRLRFKHSKLAVFWIKMNETREWFVAADLREYTNKYMAMANSVSDIREKNGIEYS